MDKIITTREYKNWLIEASGKNMIEEDIRVFEHQIDRIKECIKIAKDKLKEVKQNETRRI